MVSTAVDQVTGSPPPRVQSAWFLIGCTGPERNLSVIEVDSETFSIGRRPGVNLQLSSMRVSGRHAELLKIGEHLFIRDLGSTNGTFVNRRRVRQPTPLASGDHVELADLEFRIEHRVTQSLSGLTSVPGLKQTMHCVDSLESDWVMSQFDRLIKEQAIVPNYQPIITLSNRERIGYEALARSSMVGLETPATMFQTAELVCRQVELSLICRSRAVEMAADLSGNPKLFVNTHPQECLEVDVLPQLIRLRAAYPRINLVVEIHEGTVQHPTIFRSFADSLRENGIELAYDDFGAGQARLLELVKAPPDYLKFDSCLIRNVHRCTSNQWKMLKMLVDMARDFPTTTLAEGIETAEEAEACRDLGFDLGQGFFFGLPQDAGTIVREEARNPQIFRYRTGT